MVAMNTAAAEPAPVAADWGSIRRTALVRLTCQDVEAMVRAGVVPEDASTELLHGVLVHTDRAARGEAPLSIGDDHTICVEAFSDLRASINDGRRHVRSQQPLTCGETHEPQPDFMVVRGPLRGLRGKATAADVFCVVEVADSSYDRDAGEKLYGYAKAGVRQYVIVDLPRRVAEVFDNPDVSSGTYNGRRVVPTDGTFTLRVGDDGETLAVVLAAVLP